MNSRKIHWPQAAAALGIAALLIVIPLLIIILSPPAVIDTTEGAAHITLRAERSVIGFPGECLNVTWQVDQIQAVYLNDEGVIGQGHTLLCITPEQPVTLRVTLQDGREAAYILPVVILARQPLFWLLVGAAVILLIVGIYALIPVRASTGAAAAGGSSRAGVVLIGLFSIAFTLLLLEVGLRLYFASAGPESARIRYLYSADEIEAIDPLVDPLPYVNYYPSPRHPEHNSLGYRGPEIALPRPQDTYRIVALGGSTTYSTGTDAEHAYPALLQDILRDEYGYSNVEVVNAGFQGYTSWESLVNFAFRVLEIEPNMIILYDNYNDLIPREQASVDCYHGDNGLRGLNYARGLWVEREQSLSPSVLHRFVGVNLGWLPDPLAFTSGFTLPEVDCEPDPTSITTEERLNANPPVYFQRNLRNTLILAEANAVQPVLSTWVYFEGIDRPDYWHAAVAEHNAIIRDLAQDMDVPLIDLAETFPVDASLWEGDGIHLIDSGTQVQAQQYAAFLHEAGLLPAPASD